MRRAASLCVIVALILPMFQGCGGSGGLEPGGMPSNLDMSQVKDPMAGTQSNAPMPKPRTAKKAAR